MRMRWGRHCGLTAICAGKRNAPGTAKAVFLLNEVVMLRKPVLAALLAVVVTCAVVAVFMLRQLPA